MKSLFVLFIAFILIGIIGYRSGEPHPPMTNSLPKQTTACCVIKNENNAFWSKRFDRCASDWLERFSTKLGEEIREVNNLRIHQANAWAHPNQYKTNTEKIDLPTDQSNIFIHPYCSDRPKVSKLKN